MLSCLCLKATEWRESYYEARRSSQQFQAKCDECTAQVQREKETCDALQRVRSYDILTIYSQAYDTHIYIFQTIVSLQESFASQIEGSCQNVNSKPSQEIVRDLKRQIDDRDFLLLNLQEELRAVEKDRDAAVIAKDAMVNTHQSEINVGFITQCSLDY